MNDNKLIAEFMNHIVDWGFKKDSILYMPQGEGNSSSNSVVIPHEKLQYHTEWNWLMPVAERIDAMFGDDDEVDDAINRVHNAVLSFDIDNTYRAVVEFIKEHNDER